MKLWRPEVGQSKKDVFDGISGSIYRLVVVIALQQMGGPAILVKCFVVQGAGGKSGADG